MLIAGMMVLGMFGCSMMCSDVVENSDSKIKQNLHLFNQ